MQRWAVELTGHAFDVQDWAEALPPPGDPCGERQGETFILRWSGLESASTAGEVHERAPAILDQLNGAMFIARKSRPLRLTGGIIEFRPDGTRGRHVVMMAGAAEIRVRGSSANFTVRRQDGTIIAPVAQRSDAQRWIVWPL